MTIRELVRLMITESSNVATNMLVERVTAARATEFMRSLGTKDVHVVRGVEDGKAYARGSNNAATARGLCRFCCRLAERTVVSAKASEEMLAILRGQKFNEGIPAGLPAGTPSRTRRARSQRSITTWASSSRREEAFVLVVLTRGIEKKRDAQLLAAEIAWRVYEHATAR